MNGLDDCSGHLGCSSLAAEVGRMETLISRYSLYTHNVEGRTVDGLEHEGKVPLWIDITVTKNDLFVRSIQNLD